MNRKRFCQLGPTAYAISLRKEIMKRHIPYTYNIIEEGHHFLKEADGRFYRISKIYRETINRSIGQTVNKELKWNNRSEVMYDYGLIPVDQIM